MHDTMKSAKFIFFSAILVLFFASAGHAANEDYAALPPFLTSAVYPNVLLVMDYSGSMQAPAHYGRNFDGYESSRVADYGDKGEVSADYYSNETYYGYFDSEAYYSYNSTEGYWEVDDSTTYSGKVAGNKDSLSGNFLNFLVMSRVDVALKTLIGGKADCSGSDCELRPQGSRRWVTVDNLNATCYVRPEDTGDTGEWYEGNYLDKDIVISIEDQESQESKIGTFDSRRARVKLEDPADRTGIVQNNADTIRFGFMSYADNNNDTAEEGLIRHPLHDDSEDALISAMENTVPYKSTHTGEAMREAYRYLKQENMASYNSAYEDPGTAIDPYYSERDDGTVEPAWCRKSHVVLISDGEWNGSLDPYEWAHSLHTEDLRETDGGGDGDDFPGQQNADVYSLFAFSDGVGGENSMKTVAAFGNYDEADGCDTGEPYDFDVTDDSKGVTFPTDNCDPAGTYDDCCAEWDQEGDDGVPDGVPDAYFDASHGDKMEDALSKIFRAIKQGTSSGTAVTAITSRNTTGSAITQAVFYPEKEFEDGKKVTWTGNLFTEWYLNAYIDGNLVQNIREDTNGNLTLDISDDRILEYETVEDKLEVNAYESDSDGTKKNDIVNKTYTELEEVANLLDFGEKLKDMPSLNRNIFGVDENEDLTAFTATNAPLFDGLLGSEASYYPSALVDSGDIQYGDLIDYVRGDEISDCRSREADATGNVWKLGDIVSSSPTVVNYGDYRMIFTGSNDGMLHAFRLGYIGSTGNDDRPVELLCASPGSDAADVCSEDDLAKEEWAFIPMDSMPYLRYTADPEYDHIYNVDMKPYIINTKDQTILIGGMRLGGACGNGTVNPPGDTVDIDSEPEVGLSAYFALDITDPMNPDYLWRFTHNDLGFTYSGPSYVKRRDSSGDLRHFVVFASGPTDYDGTSVQNLKFFVVDLINGTHEFTSDALNISNPGFGGRMYSDGLDVDRDGQTDFVLFGYTSKANQDKAKFWAMDGGIMKIHTDSTDPSTWGTKKYVDSIGDPVTAPIKTMDCFSTPYLYFGSGRYFISDDDDGDVGNHLYGIPFPCLADDTGCSTINKIDRASELTCTEVVEREVKEENASWKIELNGKQGNFLRERCNTAPSTTNDDIVLFDTIMPTDAICECGGQSRSWAINCATGRGLGADDICGGDVDYEGDFMIDADKAFKYIVQLSGGDIRQIERGDFDDADTGASDFTTGVTGDEGGTLTDPFFKSTYWKQW